MLHREACRGMLVVKSDYSECPAQRYPAIPPGLTVKSFCCVLSFFAPALDTGSFGPWAEALSVGKRISRNPSTT